MTTAADITTEGVELVFVLLIEGYDTLITTGSDTAAVVSAYSATDWATCITGLQIPEDMTERLEPFSGAMTGAPMRFVVADDGADTFGQVAHRPSYSSGNRTKLTANVDVNDTTISALAAGSFAASGEAMIGNETFEYTSKTGTSFSVAVTGSPAAAKRGLYAPFKAGTGSLQRFARAHTLTDLGVAVLKPDITDYIRQWTGRYVRLMAHTVTRPGGTHTLNSFANAYTVWGGVIEAIQDSGANTVIDCKAVVNAIGDTVILRDQFRGKVQEGIYITASDTFSYGEGSSDASFPFKEANDLTLSAGYYNAHEICDALTNWLQDENAAGRINADASVTIVATPDGSRAKFRITGFTTSGAALIAGMIIAPRHILDWLGWHTVSSIDDGRHYIKIERFVSSAVSATDAFKMNGDRAPWRVNPFTSYLESEGGATTLTLDNSEGTWIAVPTDFLPDGMGELSTGDWGLLLFENRGIYWARYASDTTFDMLAPASNIAKLLGLDAGTFETGRAGGFSIDDTGSFFCRQVVVLQGTLYEVFLRMLLSTGVTSYNGARDQWVDQLGCAAPGELVGTNFENTLIALSNMAAPYTVTVVLDEPTKFSKLFVPELALRNASVVLVDGELLLVKASTPSDVDPDVTLTESNKATAAGTRDTNRSSSSMDESLVVNRITVEFGRSVDDKYQNSRTVANLASITDYGSHPITIKARNTLGADSGNADAIESLLSTLAASTLAAYAHPGMIVTRSIDRTLFASCVPGASATITDSSLRNPETGQRGITAWPAYVLETSKNWVEGIGSVKLYLASHHAKGAFAIYSPSAKIDPNDSNNYSAAITTLTTVANVFSDATYDRYATDVEAFAAGDQVRIIEESPSNVASPSTFTRVIDSVGSNSITLTASLTLTSGTTYYVVSMDRDTAQSSQQSDTYLSDATTGAIQDTVPARLWSDFPLLVPSIGFPDLTLRHRFPPSLESVDGEPVSVYSHHCAFITAQNLVNYRTCQQAPFVSGTQVSGGSAFIADYTSAGTDDWVLLRWHPVYLGNGVIPATSEYARYLEVATLLRRASGSGTVYIRVTLSRNMPTGSSWTNVTFVEPYQQVTFSSASATFAWQTRQEIKKIGALFDGTAHMFVEGKATNTEKLELRSVECWLSPMK